MSETILSPGGDNGAGEGGDQQTGDGNAPARFQDSLPDDLRGATSLQDFKDVAGLAKSYDALSSKLGGGPERILTLPEEGGDFTEIYKRLGRPDTAGEYDVSVSGTELKHTVIDEPMQKRLQEASLEAGLTKAQAKKMAEAYFERQEADLEANHQSYVADRQKKLEGLQGEWGDEFDSKKELARRAVQDLGGEELQGIMEAKAADGTMLGDSPEFIRLFAKIGEITAEHRSPDTGGGGSGMDKNTAETKLYEFEQDEGKRKILQDKSHPLYDATRAEEVNLYKAIYGEEIAIGPGRTSVSV
jgi:hypothetical protein